MLSNESVEKVVLKEPYKKNLSKARRSDVFLFRLFSLAGNCIFLPYVIPTLAASLLGESWTVAVDL
jgi:hypothetical protein